MLCSIFYDDNCESSPKKIKIERKYENEGESLQNDNGNGFFYAETETKTERCFPVEQTRKQNFPFP